MGLVLVFIWILDTGCRWIGQMNSVVQVCWSCWMRMVWFGGGGRSRVCLGSFVGACPFWLEVGSR